MWSVATYEYCGEPFEFKKTGEVHVQMPDGDGPHWWDSFLCTTSE